MKTVSHFYKDLDPNFLHTKYSSDYYNGVSDHNNNMHGSNYMEGSNYRFGTGSNRMPPPPTPFESHLLEKLEENARGTDIRYTTPVNHPNRYLFYSKTRGKSVKQMNCVYLGNSLKTLSFLDNETYFNVIFNDGEVIFYQDSLGNWYDSNVMKNGCPFWSMASVDNLFEKIRIDIQNAEYALNMKRESQYSNAMGGSPSNNRDMHLQLIAGHNREYQETINPMNDQFRMRYRDASPEIIQPKEDEEEVESKYSFGGFTGKLKRKFL